MRTGALTVNLDAHTVLLYDTEIWPTPRETQILEHLAAKIGHWCSNREILLVVWGPEYLDPSLTSRGSRRDLHHVNVCISRLRKQLGEARSLLETWNGHGYRLKQERPYDAGRQP